MGSAIPRVQLKRVNPFTGLTIDTKTWGDSHEYHRQSLQTHAIAMHGWGIVTGLEVFSSNRPDRSVWIQPGVALDPCGRLVVVPKPIHYHITAREEGLVYLVLIYHEIPTDPALSIRDGAEHPSRFLEAYTIYERNRLPDRPHIELARITLAESMGALGPLVDAEDPTLPGPNEIDTRYREQVAIRPKQSTTVGVWKPTDLRDRMHGQSAGPTRLLSVLNSGVDWHPRRRDQPQGTDQDPIDADLIIIPLHTESSFTDNEGKRLTSFLDDGGVLLVDGPIADTFEGRSVVDALARALARKPRPVEHNHLLLTVRHVFSAPPPGADPAQLYEDGGLIVSYSDYCGAWNGGTHDKPLDRAVIRSAVEFAENMLAYALIRKSIARRVRCSQKKGQV